MNSWLNLYHKLKLNLGIKRLLETHVFIPNNLKWLDNFLLYPIYNFLREYFFIRIVQYYGADYRWGDQKSHNLDQKTYNLGYGQIHHALIRSQRPKRVLCIGSMYGFVPYLMARACQENGYGHVDFVDAGYDMRKKGKHFYGQGFWKKINPKKHFDYLGAEPHITSYVMTSAQFAKKYHRRYDYLYFDGDHSFRGAFQNLRLFWPRLNPEGILCLHDIHFDRLVEGVRFEHGKMWQKLSFMPYKFELSNHYSGLGFIQKLGHQDLLSELEKKTR